MNLVSVIVPVYNVELYLEKCLDSLMNQTYKNLEILLIDDGSLDNSGSICDEYSKKDSRFVVIHKSNGGVSSARNEGLKQMNGNYFTFVDPDDVVDKNYVKILLENCLKHNCEISICGVRDVYENQQIRSCSKKFKKKIDKSRAIQEVLNSKYYTGVVWGKIYKKEILDFIRFDENLKIAEDLKFLINILENIESVYVDTTVCLYNFTLRNNSATSCEFNENWKNEILLCENIENTLTNKKLKKYAKKRYIKINLDCIIKLVREGYDLNNKELSNLIKNIKNKKNIYYKFQFKEKIKLFVLVKKFDLFKKIYDKILN